MKILIGFVLGLLALPLLAAALAYSGQLGSDSRSDPPGWELRAGGGALDAALENRAKHAGVSFAAPSDAELLLGMKEYREHCVGCHGGFRGQSDWGAHAFYPRVPQFWQQPVEVSQSEAYVAIRDGIRYSGMASWKDMMPDNEIRAMAGFISHMHSLPPAVDAVWRKAPTAGAPEAADKN